MASEKLDLVACGKASTDMLNKIGPSSECGRVFLSFFSEGISKAFMKAHVLGLILGLSEQQILDTAKATLAAYLAGLEAAPNLDEIERKR